MLGYIEDEQRAFMVAWADGEFDPDQDEEEEEADEDERLEQTLRDYNDAVCEVGY
jgi:hypothetical protein